MKQDRFYVQSFASPQDTQLVAAWDSLAQTGTGTVFQSRDFVADVHDLFLRHGFNRAHYVVLYDRLDDRPVLIMPMVERRWLNVRILETMDFDVIDYAEPLYCSIVFGDYSARCQATEAFLDFASNYDVLLSKNWSSDSGGLENTPHYFSQAPWSSEINYSVPLEQDQYETYRKRNGAFKQALKKLRRLEREFGAEVCYLTDPASIDTAFNAMLDHRRVRFNAIGKDDGMADPRRQNLFRTMAHEKCAKGDALFVGIRIDGQMIATSFALIHNGVMNAMLSSFADGPWARCSPGVGTMVLEMEWAYQNGLSKYLLGAGEASYKERLGVEEIHRMLVAEPMTSIGKAFLAGRNAKKSFKQRVKRAFPALKRPVILGGLHSKGSDQALAMSLRER